MAGKTDEKITLVGGGLAGSLLAVYLARRGFRVELYERRPDMRKVTISAGRSINLALSTRGIHALQEVGVFDRIQKLTLPMKGRLIHAVDGSTNLQRYGKDDTEVIHSVSRADLNIALLDRAQAEGNVMIQFDQRCTAYNPSTKRLFLRNEVTGREEQVEAERVIGTDGSASAVRKSLMEVTSGTCTEDLLDYGYKEIVMPRNARDTFAMENSGLHIWPRKTFMLIALPNLDGTFTCTLFLPFKGADSFDRLQMKQDVLSFFTEYFPDALKLLPNLTDEFFSHPTGSMVTVRCFPWHWKDQVCLLGDAAHAVVPFFGQGMNCSFEDCTILNDLIERFHPDWEAIFSQFEAARKKDADAIADLALENFIEMRDRVADPRFVLKKKIEKILEGAFPDRFVPKYSMVTFHRVPYSVAKSRGEIQEKILNELSEGISDPARLDLEKARCLITERVTPLGT